MLPYLGGCTPLFELMRHGNLQEQMRNKLLFHFGRCLADVHKAGICHNDYKSDNVLLKKSELPHAEFRVIDWGKAYKIGDQDLGIRRGELTMACKSLIGIPARDADIVAFFDGYASVTEWFANDRAQVVQAILRTIPADMRRSLERVWRNSLRKSRRMRSGVAGHYRYFIFKERSDARALSAVQQDDHSSLAVTANRAEEAWQAANVLLSMGRDFRGIAGLVVERRLFRSNRAMLVYDADRGDIDIPGLIANARDLLQTPWRPVAVH